MASSQPTNALLVMQQRFPQYFQPQKSTAPAPSSTAARGNPSSPAAPPAGRNELKTLTNGPCPAPLAHSPRVASPMMSRTAPSSTSKALTDGGGEVVRLPTSAEDLPPLREDTARQSASPVKKAGGWEGASSPTAGSSSGDGVTSPSQFRRVVPAQPTPPPPAPAVGPNGNDSAAVGKTGRHVEILDEPNKPVSDSDSSGSSSGGFSAKRVVANSSSGPGIPPRPVSGGGGGDNKPPTAASILQSLRRKTPSCLSGNKDLIRALQAQKNTTVPGVSTDSSSSSSDDDDVVMAKEEPPPYVASVGALRVTHRHRNSTVGFHDQFPQQHDPMACTSPITSNNSAGSFAKRRSSQVFLPRVHLGRQRVFRF